MAQLLRKKSELGIPDDVPLNKAYFHLFVKPPRAKFNK